MRRLACIVAVAWLAGCNLYGPCCTNTDCAGGGICSVDDDKCPGTGHPRGLCLTKCSIDHDCADGYVCNVIVLNCGCQLIGDGGTEGTCAPGVGDN